MINIQIGKSGHSFIHFKPKFWMNYINTKFACSKMKTISIIFENTNEWLSNLVLIDFIFNTKLRKKRHFKYFKHISSETILRFSSQPISYEVEGLKPHSQNNHCTYIRPLPVYNNLRVRLWGYDSVVFSHRTSRSWCDYVFLTPRTYRWHLLY